MREAAVAPAPAPVVAASTGSTRDNRTGSWKYIRPVYHDRLGPCSQACPVGIDIPAYMSLLQEGRVEEACEVLRRENPLPAVTGRVCDHPCEASCNRGVYDGAVSVHAVERVLGDFVLEGPLPARAPRTRPERVAVVGSGPAGLACAYHLARMGYGVTVYEAAPEPGGMLRLGIPAYRLPRDVLDREIEHIRALGVEIRCGVRVGRDVPWRALDAYAAVFLATGAHRGRPLGIPGEELEGVWQGLDFLRRVNAGERPPLGRRVVVVGGGNTAMDCARTALRLGARPVVVYRRSRAEMPAIPAEVEEAEREGVEFVFLAAPLACHGGEGRLERVELTRMELGDPDESGRRRPVPVEDGAFDLAADAVLLATGEEPELDRLPAGVVVEGGAIRTQRLGETPDPRFFAGGDVAGDARTVATALGAGKRAAIGIDRRLRAEREEAPDPAALRFGPNGTESMARWLGGDPVPRTDPLNEVVPPEDVNLRHFESIPAGRDRHLPGSGEATGFAEANQGLAPLDALEEAYRCFACGLCNGCELCLIFCPDVAVLRDGAGGARFRIELDYCKGCGVCAAECPRGALQMTREGL